MAALDQGVPEAVARMAAPAAMVVPMEWATAVDALAEVGLVAAVEEGRR